MKKDRYEAELARAQLEALKARMNPHFISNALTSIRSMLFKDQKDAAIEYLTYFARLIRTTLENASKEFIILASEIEYIRNYLEVEKLRFADKFSSEVIIQPNLQIMDIVVPPTIFQPYIENAINHGLMHKTSDGVLKVLFEITDNQLNCIVEDNGVGRKRTREIEENALSSRHSQSESITRDRFALLNKIYHTNEYRIETNDLSDSYGQPSGTRVLLQLPVKYIYDLT